MNAVNATWRNGQVLPGEPVDWPEGSELVIEPVGATVGLDEAEWRDDPAALADWDAWLRTVEPRILADEERMAFEAYEAEVRRHDLEQQREPTPAAG
jgi:hypothetical protein